MKPRSRTAIPARSKAIVRRRRRRASSQESSGHALPLPSMRSPGAIVRAGSLAISAPRLARRAQALGELDQTRTRSAVRDGAEIAKELPLIAAQALILGRCIEIDLEEIGHGNAEKRRRRDQAPGTQAVRADLVFLDGLAADAERAGEFLLGGAGELARLAQPRADRDVGGIGRALAVPRRPPRHWVIRLAQQRRPVPCPGHVPTSRLGCR